MKTRHTVEGSFGSEFPAICNHCGLKSQDLESLWEMFAFFWKNNPLRKIFKIMFRKFSPPHRSTLLCSDFGKLVRREIGEIVRYLQDRKNSAASQTAATSRIAPKICQDKPPTIYSVCSRFHPNQFTFGGVIAERVNTNRALKWIQYSAEAIASSRITTTSSLTN